MKFHALAVSVLALTVVSGNVTKAVANDSQIFGAVIGAATGGFLGSNIGSGKGQLAATAAGTLIGAMIGSSMAQASDYPAYGSTYPVAYTEPEPVYVYQEPRPVYVVQQPPRRVVVKREVVVKHVYTPAPQRVMVIKVYENDRHDRYDHRDNDNRRPNWRR